MDTGRKDSRKNIAIQNQLSEISSRACSMDTTWNELYVLFRSEIVIFIRSGNPEKVASLSSVEALPIAFFHIRCIRPKSPGKCIQRLKKKDVAGCICGETGKKTPILFFYAVDHLDPRFMRHWENHAISISTSGPLDDFIPCNSLFYFHSGQIFI